MKLTTAQGEHSATGCLLDYECIKIIVDQWQLIWVEKKN